MAETPDPELVAARAAELSARAKRNPYPEMDEELLEKPDIDAAIECARGVAKWQIENIMSMKAKAQQNPPKENKVDADARARDARTLNELVRTLERLDALEKSRKLSGRAKKVKHEADLKAALVRRLDQLVAASRADAAAGKPERG